MEQAGGSQEMPSEVGRGMPRGTAVPPTMLMTDLDNGS